MAYRHYTELRVWQQAMDLSLAAYDLSDSFPRQELYGITSQLRRAALSVQLNISEGHGRATPGDFQRSLSIANGSLNETDNILRFCARRGYATASDLAPLFETISQIGMKLVRLQQALGRQRSKTAKRSNNQSAITFPGAAQPLAVQPFSRSANKPQKTPRVQTPAAIPV